MSGLINIELSEDVLLATGQSQEEFVKEAKFLLALKLFEMGRLSSSQAGEICDMSRLDFLLLVGKMGIAIADLDEEEMEREFVDE